MKASRQLKARNIALTGFRATGKSSIGRLLARYLGWKFVDMDERLVESFGQDIESWVRLHGWESFREAESKLLKAMAGEAGLIVATGGGATLKAANRELLRNHFLVVWLKASADTIYTRLTRDPNTPSQRPPLTVLPLREEIEQLLLDRSRFYEETADLAIDTEGRPAQSLASELEKTLRQRLPMD